MVALSAVSAELLAAYGDSTGDLGLAAFSVVYFSALYGAPALLAREVARRAGWGWPSLLLLFLALGLTQACIIDQSMFSDDYEGYDGWEESWKATLVQPLGINASNTLNFLVGHVIFSFGAPVALAEAWRRARARARAPWLGRRGLIIAGLAYLAAATLIMFQPGSHAASQTQLGVSVGLVVGCVGLAALVGRRHRQRPAPEVQRGRRAPTIAVTFTIALVLAVARALVAETWAGFAQGVVVTALAAAFVWLSARRPGWGIRHAAAVALAFLVANGLLAFTYFPLLGEVSAGAKYAHNVVMLLVVLTAGWFALRTGGSSSARPAARPAPTPPTPTA